MKVKWLFRIFAIIFCFLSFKFDVVRPSDAMYSSIYFWTSEIDKEKIQKTFDHFCIDSCTLYSMNDYPWYIAEFNKKNKFYPHTEIKYNIKIDDNRISGVVNVDSTKSLIILCGYKYGIDGAYSVFFRNKEIGQILEITKQFEDNVLCSFRNVETDRWRIYRNVYAYFFWDYQFLFYLGFIIIDRIICWTIKKRKT